MQKRNVVIDSIIDHTSISVKNLEQSKTFYEYSLATLGYEQLIDFGDFIVYGTNVVW